MNLRDIKRYYVQAPVFFSWKSSDGSSQTAEGMTRDISTGAIFVRAHNCPAAGNQVRIDVLLPSLRKNLGVRLRGEGVVLRVDHADSADSGFAVATCLRRTETRDSTYMLSNVRNDCERAQ